MNMINQLLHCIVEFLLPAVRHQVPVQAEYSDLTDIVENAKYKIYMHARIF